MSKYWLVVCIGIFLFAIGWSIMKLAIYNVGLENPTINNTIRYIIWCGIFNLTLTFAGILAIYFKVKP